MLSRRPSLNHVRFILPNAPVQPVSLNMGMPMPSWFDITTLEDISEAEDERGLLKSSGEINRLIQAEIDGSAEGLGGKGIEAGRVVVGGFSQVSGGAGRSEPASKAEASTSRAGNSIVKVTSSSSAIADAAKALLQSFSGSAGSDGSRGIRKGSILGVGVDIMHRPRLASLLRRQERRLRSPVDSAVSMRHFARRILCQVEADELSALSKATTIPLGSLEQWLAVRCVSLPTCHDVQTRSQKLRCPLSPASVLSQMDGKGGGVQGSVSTSARSLVRLEGQQRRGRGEGRQKAADSILGGKQEPFGECLRWREAPPQRQSRWRIRNILCCSRRCRRRRSNTAQSHLIPFGAVPCIPAPLRSLLMLIYPHRSPMPSFPRILSSITSILLRAAQSHT